MFNRFKNAFNQTAKQINFKAGVKFVQEITVEVIQIMAIMHVITSYGVNGTLCVGPSMIPTLNENGDFVIIDKFSSTIKGRRYQKDDVIIAICPYDPLKTICKRIGGIEGDIINQVIVIPRGHVWLAGDNASNSLDSRRYGPVPEGLIIGRALWKIRTTYPFIFPVEASNPSIRSTEISVRDSDGHTIDVKKE